MEINDPNQYPSNGLPIWHGLPDLRSFCIRYKLVKQDYISPGAPAPN